MKTRPVILLNVPPNAAGQDFVALPIPLENVDITGTITGTVDAAQWFTATAAPSESHRPVTYIWQATGHPPISHPDRLMLTDTVSYTWDVGGLKTITVTAANAGATVTDIHAHYVLYPVEADFSGAPTVGPAPLTVIFTNTSTGDYDASVWSFGDGLTSTLQHPVHDYGVPGVYTVTLTVSGPGGTDREVRGRYITAWHVVYLPVALR